MRITSFCLLIFCFVAARSSSLDSLERAIKSCSVDSDCVNTRLELVRVHFQRGEADKAMFYAKEALDYSTRAKYLDGEIRAHVYLGNVLLGESKVEEAERHYAIAASIAGRLKDKAYLRLSMLNLGNIEMERADYPTALKYFFASLRLAEELKDSISIGEIHNSIGNVYDRWSDYKNAEIYYNEALKILTRQGDSLALAPLINNLAGLKFETGQLDKAIEYHFSAIEIEKRFEDMIGLAYSYNNLGQIYIAKKEYALAEKYINQALEIRRSSNDLEGTVSCYVNLADLKIDTRDYVQSEKYLKEAESISHSGNFIHLLQDVYGQFSTLYELRSGSTSGAEKINDLKLSLSYRKKFTALKDSVFNSEYNRKLAEIQGKFESEKKQRHIADLEMRSAIQQGEYNRQKFINYGVAGGLMLVLSFSVVLFNRFKITKSQKLIIENQKKIVEEKNKDITDSINYSRRIQHAILVPPAKIRESVPQSFVFYQPKDIVSGDFYFFSKAGNKIVLAVADCTGHGVPGAFMSLIGNNILDKLVREQGITDPSKILKELHAGVMASLHQDENESESKDGMEIALCTFSKETMSLEYAGAMRNLYLVRSGGDFEDIKSDKHSIGGAGSEERNFTTKSFQLAKGDSFYMMSDGFADQFGGSEGKKFMTRRLKDLILQIYQLDMDVQLAKLGKSFTTWKGAHEQVDDVCVVGVRV